MIPLLPVSRPRRRSRIDEFITGHPERVARNELIWTPELDIRVVEADGPDLTRLAVELNVSLPRLQRRRDALMAQVFQEMLEGGAC